MANPFVSIRYVIAVSVSVYVYVVCDGPGLPVGFSSSMRNSLYTNTSPGSDFSVDLSFLFPFSAVLLWGFRSFGSFPVLCCVCISRVCVHIVCAVFIIFNEVHV
jgi:hypothetical protein